MYLLALTIMLLVPVGPSRFLASEQLQAPTSGYNERLDKALGQEGGVQVYMDEEGNVGTIIDPPGGERRMTVQPPQSPSMNLGPPLQLHNPPSQIPQTGTPAQPQKAPGSS